MLLTASAAGVRRPIREYIVSRVFFGALSLVPCRRQTRARRLARRVGVRADLGTLCGHRLAVSNTGGGSAMLELFGAINQVGRSAQGWSRPPG